MVKRFFAWLLGILVAGGVGLVLGINETATFLIVTLGVGVIIGEFILGIARALGSKAVWALVIIIAVLVAVTYILKGAALF